MTPLSHLVFGAALAVLIAVALVLLFPGSACRGSALPEPRLRACGGGIRARQARPAEQSDT